MDVTTLRDRIHSTLDTNADTRRQAELDLKYVSRVTSLLPLALMLIIFWHRPKNSPVSPTPCSTFCKSNRIMACAYPVCQYQESYLSLDRPLTRCSCCLSQKSNHPGMGTPRGQPTPKPHPRIRARTLSRTLNTDPCILTTPDSGSAHTDPTNGPATRLPGQMAKLHEHDCATTEYQRCQQCICRLTMSTGYMSCLQVQIWRE